MSRQINRYALSVITAACLLLTGLSSAIWAQSQSESAPSVAEAARRAREKKKENSKPVRTVTNDDLPAAPAGEAAAKGAVSPTAEAQSDTTVTAEPPANEGGGKKPAAADNEQAGKQKADNAAELERAKKQLAQSLSELDIMQRKAALDSDSYYSKTDFASDTAGKAALDAEAEDINRKKDEVADLKARVAELQASIADAAENGSDKSEESDQTEKNPPSR